MNKPSDKQMLLGCDYDKKVIEHEDGSITLTPMQHMAIQQLLRRLSWLQNSTQDTLEIIKSSKVKVLKDSVEKNHLSLIDTIHTQGKIISELLDPTNDFGSTD